MSVSLVPREAYGLVKIDGSFDAAGHVEVRRVCNSALEEQHTTLVFDLTDCTFVDSSAIGLMVEMHRKVAPEGGSVGLLGPNDTVRRIIALTKTDEIVRIYDSEEDIRKLD
jgi:anti-anti-sigma factor